MLLIFLLTVLPLQMSWAVAAVYCQHEQAPPFKHIGQQTQADIADDPDSQFNVHSDCGDCHGVTQAAFMLPAMPDVIATGSPIKEAPPLSFSSHIPDGPLRPDRCLVA